MMKQLVKIGLLVSMGLFLFSRLMNGTLSFYIHPRFNSLTLLAAAGFLVMAASYFYDRQKSDHEGHDHDISWLGLSILALPVLIGLAVPPQPLGAFALGNREVNVGTLTSARAPESSRYATLANSGEKNIMDWLYAFQRNPDVAAFNSHEANVIGFVYRDERFAADTFMVGRFVVSCCVADAAPIGLIVQWPEAADFPDNEWIEVSGAFQAGEFNGRTMPILAAATITKTEPPAQPYLYP